MRYGFDIAIPPPAFLMINVVLWSVIARNVPPFSTVPQGLSLVNPPPLLLSLPASTNFCPTLAFHGDI
jgi:hypothetical protein